MLTGLDVIITLLIGYKFVRWNNSKAETYFYILKTKGLNVEH